MAEARLELASNYGDETLSRLRFVMYGTKNATETAAVREFGLHMGEGRPVLSADLVQVYRAMQQQITEEVGRGGEPGSLLVCTLPPGLHLGYGVFTTAYVDRAQKRVTGAPLKYVRARGELALYGGTEAEDSRVHIEAEVANGYLLERRPQVVMEPQYVVGEFIFGAVFANAVQQLKVAVDALEALEFERLERALVEVIQPSIPADAVLMPTAVRDLIVGTVESELMSRLRLMHFQTLALLGYSFVERDEPVTVSAVKDANEQRRRMDEFARSLASSSFFAAEFAWFKVYGTRQLDLMRVELDGAELLLDAPDTSEHLG